MESAAELVWTARRRRRLTKKELARISGVSAATLSRIESGKVDTAYGTVMKLLRALGYRAVGDLVPAASDEPIAAAIDSAPSVAERFDVYRVAAQVSPVTARAPSQARSAVAIGAKTLWQQLGLMSEEADRIATEGGLDSVWDRCVKIEHARLFGGLNWAGVNTKVISAHRPKQV